MNAVNVRKRFGIGQALCSIREHTPEFNYMDKRYTIVKYKDFTFGVRLYRKKKFPESRVSLLLAQFSTVRGNLHKGVMLVKVLNGRKCLLGISPERDTYFQKFLTHFWMKTLINTPFTIHKSRYNCHWVLSQ